MGQISVVEGGRVKELAFVPIESMPSVPGLRVPEQVYWILRRPAPLLGMMRPSDDTPWHALHSLGVRSVVCLTDDAPPYDPSPLALACAVSLQDLYGGIVPDDPRRERARIAAAVEATLAALGRGEGVVVHCAGGTGRTGTVLCAALVALDIPAADAFAHIQAVSKLRRRQWPESPWQQELLLQL